MKTLLIIRHAKSSWRFPDLSDHERPLNARGNRDAPLMAEVLKEKKVTPQLFISSTALRARKTAEVFAGKLNYPLGEIVLERELFHSSPETILKVIERRGGRKDCLAVFGHNPGLTWLVNRITSPDISNLPTTGIVAVEFDIDEWAELKGSRGKRLFFEYPKKHNNISK